MGEVTKTRRTLIVPNQAIATYVTQWTYDSHNRLLEMIYPDEEKVTYTYDMGGQLTNVHGYKSYGYDYVSRIGYDKFGQRTYMKYCNGAETFYTYDPQRRRLQNLKVNAGGNTIMDNAYTYDAVSNVLSVANGAALPQSGKAGGQMSHSYTYDALYRLTGATGTYTGADSKTASYTLAMGYDNMHRITSKSQHLTQDNLQFDGTLNVGYDLTYTYGQDEGKKFQLANVSDVNYRTEATPDESQKTSNSHAYEYDANGNLVYVNTGRVKKDGGTDEKAHERKLKWDEENRLLASDDDGFVTNYWYDADGERTVKTSGESEQVYVNSEFAGGRTNTAKFSLYVSPYLVANQGGRYTKHIYIGSQRIVSKIGDFASYGADPRRIQYAGKEADAVNVDYDVKYSQQLQAIKENYATFGVPYNGTDNDDYVDGEGFCCNDGTMEAAIAQANAPEDNFQEGDAYENLQFYYHTDHLGSSSYITNLDGEVVQHIEYVPFGEVFIEERNNIWNTPYLFNAKEFDEETGLYYYGARYYDPRLSLWMSTDPLEETAFNIGSYTYCHNNPIIFIDKDGRFDFDGTVENNKYYAVIAVFPMNLSDHNGAILKDYLAAVNSGVPVIRVTDMKDFANAMYKLKEINTVTKTYTLNSHGYRGNSNTPAYFNIGSDKITPETDFTMLKDGLNNHNVFIGACDIGTLEGRGYELVENMAKQTSSLVVASDHPIRAGYKYDGSNYLNNDDIKIPFKPTSPQNEFMYSNRGEPFGFIKNVTIDKNKGMSWSFDINNSFRMNLFAK